MPRRAIVSLLLVVILGLAPAAGVAPTRIQSAYAEPSDLEPPEVPASAVLLMDDLSGDVLFQHNARKRLHIASLTKMMTALVAVEHAGLDFPVMATENSYAEPAIIGLQPGDRLRLEDMLYGLLLESGNDAALAIAESVGGGSIERFVEWMNEKAQAMGLVDTHFVNPHGLDDDGHYSTAADLATIARLFLRHPLLARIAATKSYEVRDPKHWAFSNVNRLLYSYEGADGVKTGYETLAGKCIVASATRDGRRLLAVVLNSDSYVQDAATLLNYGFELSRYLPYSWPLRADWPNGVTSETWRGVLPF